MGRLDSDRAKGFCEYINHSLSLTKYDWKTFMNLCLKDCRLCANRSNTEYPVPSFGDKSAKVLVLESNPGKLQVEKGSEFIQDTSVMRLLVRYLNELGYTLQDIYLTYAFHCNTQRRYTRDYDKCSLWLSYEMSNLEKCDTIITLGDDAFHMIMGEGYPRLIDIFGRTYKTTINNREYKVIPLLHPWFILRNPSYLPKVSSYIDSLRSK